MGDVKQTLADYDAVHKRFRESTGVGASSEIAELLELGHRAIRQLRNEPTVIPPRTITLFRQRLVTIKANVDQTDIKRRDFLLNSVSEDQDHNPFESWATVSCDIVFKGEPVTWGTSTMQRVIGLVTESRIVTLEDDKESDPR